MLTKQQLSLFWRTLQQSCNAQQITTTTTREDYRKLIMREECGAAHMSNLNRTTDFDRIMLRLNLDAGDYEAAARFESGSARRLAHLVEVCAAQLMQLKGSQDAETLDYVLGVVKQARFACRQDGDIWWIDLGKGRLLSLFTMLDTHRRRLLKAANWPGSFKFSADIQYGRDSQGNPIQHPFPLGESALLIRVA